MGEALGTSAALCIVCPHCAIALLRRGLSTSPFRRCSFTPHPPIRLRTQRLCVRKLYKPTGRVSSRLVARRSAAVSHWTLGHTGGTARTHTVTLTGGIGHLDARRISTPSRGSADHWVVSDPCPGREHNAIALSTLLQRSSYALHITSNGPNNQNHSGYRCGLRTRPEP